MAKGILKSPSAEECEDCVRSGGPQRGSRKLQWDEEALRQNALELEQLEHAHPVTEPKTPFARCSESPERALSSPAGEHGTCGKDAEGGDGRPDGAAGGMGATEKRQRRNSSWSTSSEDDTQLGYDAEEDLAAVHEHGPEEEKRFREHRRQHYQMRNALRLGKQLLSSEDEG